MMFDRQRILILALCAALAGLPTGCKSSGGLFGQPDETAEAGELVRAANGHLREISRLYERNEGKRAELTNALGASDAVAVRAVCKDIVDSINSGKAQADAASEKIDEALGRNINEDYREYLDLKRDALKKQIQAFEEYRQAARKLSAEYDPKDAQAKELVVADFKQRSESFQKLMQQGRELSDQANEKAKSVMQRSNEE
jgi:hypothetical protein